MTPANAGTENAWIRYVAEGNGVILDGSETISTAGGWTDEGDGVYSAPYGRTPAYMALDTVRLYQHTSLDSLRAGGDGIAGGFFVSGGRLYVKAPDGAPLTGRDLRAAAYDYGFYINGKSHLLIHNLEIRYFNSFNVRVRNSHHIAVRSCAIHHSRQMVRIDGITSTDNLVENCTIYGTGVTGWPWGICHHDHDCSSDGISVSNAGEGNVVRGNRCKGLYNGIYLGQWTTAYPDENALENDVYDNVLEQIVDDGLEPECKAINLRLYGNRFRNVYSPISLAPIETGPAWVMYNVIDDTWPGSPGFVEWGGNPGWIKISTTPAGELPLGRLRIYHNTAYIRTADTNGWGSSGSGYTHLKNNIVRATRYVFENTSPAAYPPGNDWDYNNFYTTGTQYIKFENVRYDAAGFRAATGFQTHGVSAEPVFVNAAGGDFRPAAGDPGIDKGVYLPGINDGYSGGAPDMGAYEFVPQGINAPGPGTRGIPARTFPACRLYDLHGNPLAPTPDHPAPGIYILVREGAECRKVVRAGRFTY